MPAAGVVAAALTTGLAIATVVGFARQDRAVSVEHSVPTLVLLIGLAGVLAISTSVWAARTQHPHVSVGLAAAAVGELLPVWAGWSSLPGGVRAGVLAAAPLAVGGSAQVALRWSGRPVRSVSLRWVWLLVGSGSLIHLAAYNPFADPSCRRTCDDVLPVARDAMTTHSAVVITCLLTVTAALIAALALSRSRSLRPPGPVVAAVHVALALLIGSAIVTWVSWGRRPPSDIVVVLLPSGAMAVLGVAVVAVAIRVRRTRRFVDRLVTRLSEPESALRDLGGAIRAIHFAVPGEGRWVDSAGQYVVDAPGRGGFVDMADDAGPVLRLFLARPEDSIDSLAGLSSATRLALRNAQLAAVGKARLADVQASRRRVVATSDAERQRIERDLHDGAQQRLVSAAFYLSVARRRLPSDGRLLTRAENTVSTALSNLRAISHGIFPSALATEGLGVALENLVGESEVPARLDLHNFDAEVPAETAMAAYATVAAALATAGASNATEARISVDSRDWVLTVCVETDIPGDTAGPSAFTEVIDRVGAVGGHFSTSTTKGVAHVKAEFPCVS